MSECVRTECDECLPLFRYFVNQQEAVIEPAQVITPECPQGYQCQPGGDYVIPEQRIIPDLPVSDPDLEPVEEIFYNDYSTIRPRLFAVSPAVTATCQDIDPDSPGAASETAAAGLHTVAYSDPSGYATALAQATQLAFASAKNFLQSKIDRGEKNCYLWELQNAFALLAGNTANFGDFTADSVFSIVPPEGATPGNYWGWYQWHKIFGPFSVNTVLTATASGNLFLNTGVPPYTAANTCQLRELVTWVDPNLGIPLTMSPTPIPASTFIDETADNRYVAPGNHLWMGTAVVTIPAGTQAALQINRWLLFRKITGTLTDYVIVTTAPA